MVCDRLRFFFSRKLPKLQLVLVISWGVFFSRHFTCRFLFLIWITAFTFSYVANQPKRIRRSELILNEPSLYNDSLSLLCYFLLLTFSNHRKGMLIDPRCVSWAAGGWHGRWNWTRLEWFHGTFSLSRRLLISLSEMQRTKSGYRLSFLCFVGPETYSNVCGIVSV
jgi:hypothetical protein